VKNIRLLQGLYRRNQIASRIRFENEASRSGIEGLSDDLI